MAEGLKLTLYFGERDRAHSKFLADALVDLYEQHKVTTSVMLRGIEGFGLKHQLHTQRLLTLSEDLPLVSIAVDSRSRVERLLPDVRELMRDGLLSLERARVVTEDIGDAARGLDPSSPARFTIYAGRAQRERAQPAYVRAVEVLRRCGLSGASAIPAVDGTRLGERRRARFFSRNVDVPLMLLAMGPTEGVTAALPELGRLFREPVVTLERVWVLKRDGQRLDEPFHVSELDDAGLPVWQKIMVHAEEQAKANGRPLYVELVRRLRLEGAAGATVLRGAFGFYGAHEPFRDRFLALRRNVPVHAVIVDTPDRVRDWWPVVDEVTSRYGLVTSEPVPASHAKSAEAERGGFRRTAIHRLLTEDATSD